jgi:hypothetical protein
MYGRLQQKLGKTKDEIKKELRSLWRLNRQNPGNTTRVSFFKPEGR